ncbi:GNAT family N-acetyltransferase [Novosphingobium sp.]|uniref:GNAT family N-acetyltransferase n=1 Tax=Novosphingobium sp. TaxID=1874826 RepID=UPI003B52D922
MLTTARLELSQPVAADLAGVAAMVAPETVRRFLGNRPVDMAAEYARFARNAGSWALYGYGSFMVRERGSAPIIGICGVFHSWRGFDQGFDDTPEIGWIIGDTAWGRGYATEAARAALAWFDHMQGPRRIACMIEQDNTPSFAIAARLGFVAYAQQDYGGRMLSLLQRGEDAPKLV